MLMLTRKLLCLLVVSCLALPLFAQTEQYGTPITADVAKKVAAAAIADAKKNNFTMAIALVHPNGFLGYFEKMDTTHNGSVNIAHDTARTPALVKRPTRVV